jgi:hypothetical protein
VSGAVPVAAAANVAVCPAVTVWLAGCVVMVGATGAGFTVRVAAELVAVPAVLLTATVKVAPLSVVVVAGVV